MDSEDEVEEPYRGVPATIILINVFGSSTEMAKVAQTATCSLLRQYFRHSTSQCLAVCFFGAEDTDNNSKFNTKNVVDVFSLVPPSINEYNKLRELDITKIKPAKELIMCDALEHCSKLFQECKKVLSTRTIIILTKLDQPPTLSDQKPTLTRVEDLVDDVDFRIINVAETEYNIDQFYKDFMVEANKGRDINLPDPIWCPRELENMMFQESHRHLALARIRFEIGNGINIGVGVYSLIKSKGQARHKTAKLDRDTGEVLTRVTKVEKVSGDDGIAMHVDENTKQLAQKKVPIHKSELLHYQEFGGERIEFTANEMKTIKNPFGPPMLKLLGFKPTSLMYKEKWYFKRSYFLFPNEDIIHGSTEAFKALHQACVETKMVAICLLCTRVNSKPFNVALAPCTNPLGLTIDVGFDVICLPFVENVRDIPKFEEDNMEITNSQKAVMTNIIECLTFSYTPEMFENPKLQSEYRVIESKEFEDDVVEPFIDTTMLGCDKFDSINVQSFENEFGPFGAAAKRPAESKTAVKKVKGEIDFSYLRSGKVDKYTAEQLKNILKSKDIPQLPALTGLKKADLVELVCKHSNEFIED